MLPCTASGLKWFVRLKPLTRKPHRVFRVHLDILRYPRIDREEIREAAARSDAHVVLRRIRHQVGKAAAILGRRRDSEFRGNWNAPQERNRLGRSAGRVPNMIRADDRRGKRAQVSGEIVQIAAAARAHVGESTALALRPGARGAVNFELAVARVAGAAQQDGAVMRSRDRAPPDPRSTRPVDWFCRYRTCSSQPACPAAAPPRRSSSRCAARNCRRSGAGR